MWECEDAAYVDSIAMTFYKHESSENWLTEALEEEREREERE